MARKAEIVAKANGSSIQIDTAAFLSSVGTATAKIVTGQLSDAAQDLPAIAASIGLSKTVEQRAWLLITRAAERALSELVSDYAKSANVVLSFNDGESYTAVNAETTLTITPEFLHDPTAHELIKSLSPDFIGWLSNLGITKTDAANIIQRAGPYFATALHNEWASNHEFYAPIEARFTSPFQDAAQNELEWQRYKLQLHKIAADRVFDQSYGLRQIYIAPRATHIVDSDAKNSAPQNFSETDSGTQTHVLGWLHDTITRWATSDSNDDYIRVVSGGPGAGKSSFAKIYASDFASIPGNRVILIPLHQLDLSVGISRSFDDYFSESGHFSSNPLKRPSLSAPLLLILDGLDEIQMQGKAAQEVAAHFVTDLIRFVERTNSESTYVRVVITGRELAIQSTESNFRQPGQILHIQPYKIDKIVRSISDPLDIKNIDQRDAWWNRFGTLINKNFDGAPADIKRGELDEVTAQPLLNYLVAMSYLRGGITLDANTNVNAVYGDLLSGVFERGWSKHDHPALAGVEKETFVRLLEEVSTSVWHGAGRTTTLREIEDRCAQSKIGNLLPALEAGSTSGVSSLLLSFYFRQKGRRQDGDKTFEFTHKSFAEYLTCLAIARCTDLVSKQLHQHLEDVDFGWDAETCLHRWATLCGPTELDQYLVAFIRREFDSKDIKTLKSWKAALEKLVSHVTQKSWPAERFGTIGFAEQNRWCRNAEEALYVTLNACSRTLKELAVIEFGPSTGFGDALKRIQGQRAGAANRPLFSSLSYMSLDGACLDMADLYAANLSHSSFRGSMLHFTTMHSANLSSADFTGAVMLATDISAADVNGSKFSFDAIGQIILDRDDIATTRRPRDFDGWRALEQEIAQELIERGAIVFDLDGKRVSSRRRARKR